MVGPATRNLREESTYWAPLSADEWGIRGYAAPVKILSRWNQAGEVITKADGEEYTPKAVVFVDRHVETQGYLAKGDHTAQANPLAVGAQEIQAYREIPDLRNIEQERKAYL